MGRIFILFFILTLPAQPLFAQKKPAWDVTESIGRGKEIYRTQCRACHQETGEGIGGIYPPLAKSDYLMADKKRSALQILRGLSGPIEVKGITYDGEMNRFKLRDQEVSDVLNYIRNSWGNKGEVVSPDDVRSVRK